MKLEINTVVIAPQGHFRTSLVALLASIPQITAVKTCDDLTLALGIPESYVPQIVFYESDQPAAVGEALGQLRQRWPAARQVVLAEHPGKLGSGHAIGADLVLTKEVQAGEFLRLIRRLAGTSSTFYDHWQYL